MKLRRPVKLSLRQPPKSRARAGKSTIHSRAATADEVYDEEEEDYESEDEPNMKLSHAFIVVLILHVIAIGAVFTFTWIKDRQTAEAKAAAVAKAAAAPKEEPAAEPAAPPAPAAPAASGKTHTVAAGDTLKRIATQYGTSIEALEKENSLTNYSIIRVGQVLQLPASAKMPAGSSTMQPVAKTTAAASKPIASTPSTSTSKDAFLATQKPEAAAAPKTTDAPKATETTKAPTPAATAPKTAESAPSGVSDGIYTVAKGDNPYTIAKKLHVSYSALLTANDIKDPKKIQIGQKLKVPAKKN
jgi:LysM repeat protein